MTCIGSRFAPWFVTLAVTCLLVSVATAQSTEIITLVKSASPLGSPPDGCRPALTGLGGAPKWQVQLQPYGSIAEVGRELIEDRYPICIVDSVRARDVDLSVDFTPLDGKIDQAAGLMVRVKGPQEYYVLRANALEGNVNLYHVTEGIRRQFAGHDIAVPSGKTQRLGLRIQGDTLTASLDNKVLFEVKDTTISGDGAVGIWTKADSLVAFSNLTAKVLTP